MDGDIPRSRSVNGGKDPGEDGIGRVLERIRPSHHGAGQYEVPVPGGELDEAQEVLCSIL
ncbi:hypothetical protein JQC72_05565 [Polycladomyces sp. WAk]|uniref:Uncharacterized protein n=1 Tax=Polycladomyces zharkentensis TaxID=2807616 RepID=A0ABS2WHN8_9BACL|nr:hypothetical protein [Polycladomyces sp. WAk]MBN2908991.1 hypothetical protein [Polycladomyces sp. WAk]